MKYTLLFLSLILSIPSFAQREATPEDAARMRKMLMGYSYVENLYVDTVNADRLVEYAIRGILKELDPHSVYTNAEETKRATEPLQGNFEGIGVSFNVLEDTLVVLQTVPGGPSEKRGIQPGDRIVRCNDTVMAGVKMPRDKMMKLLRGPRGSHALLGVKRGADTTLVYFDIVRDKIPLNTVDAVYMIRPQVGFIRLSSFGATTYEEVANAVDSLKGCGMRSLILDLQMNGGGYLNAAQGVASLFLDEGKVVVSTKGRVVAETLKTVAVPKKSHFDGQLVVLVDEHTASAAEIVSGAVQDYDCATIVGRRTFGKGLVQRPCYLPDGSMMRLTIARYYTPTGRCIQKPYVKGHSEDYAKDIEHRLKSGELTCRDSIHFADSLCYKTLVKGRTVYGGGGIMPDVFVPLDTTVYTAYHRQLAAKNCIITATLKYVDAHRESLRKRYPNVDVFARDYTVEEALWAELEREAEKAKVRPKDDAEREASRERIGEQLKALLARDLWDMAAYYRIWNENSDIVQAGLRVIDGRE